MDADFTNPAKTTSASVHLRGFRLPWATGKLKLRVGVTALQFLELRIGRNPSVGPQVSLCRVLHPGYAPILGSSVPCFLGLAATDTADSTRATPGQSFPGTFKTLSTHSVSGHLRLHKKLIP